MKPPNTSTLFLLSTVLMAHHGTNDVERASLEELATRFDATASLEWALDFVRQDPPTCVQRTWQVLSDLAKPLSDAQRMDIADTLYHLAYEKKYLTQAEALFIRHVLEVWQLQPNWEAELEAHTP